MKSQIMIIISFYLIFLLQISCAGIAEPPEKDVSKQNVQKRYSDIKIIQIVRLTDGAAWHTDFLVMTSKEVNSLINSPYYFHSIPKTDISNPLFFYRNIRYHVSISHTEFYRLVESFSKSNIDVNDDIREGNFLLVEIIKPFDQKNRKLFFYDIDKNLWKFENILTRVIDKKKVDYILNFAKRKI